MADAINLADKQLKRVQRYARLVRDQGMRAMPRLRDSLVDLMRQLDEIHEITMAIRTSAGAISSYGQERIASVDRALDALHRFVRDPVQYAQRSNVSYGFEKGEPSDIAIRASDVAANAFQGVRAARTIVASARRDVRRVNHDPRTIRWDRVRPQALRVGDIVWFKSARAPDIEVMLDVLTPRGLDLWYHGPGDRYQVRPARSTSRDPKLDKRTLWKDIDRTQRQKDRTVIARLKSDVRRAREDRARALVQAKRKCTRERTRAIREGQRLRERAKQRARQIRAQARGACQLGRAYAQGTRETIQEKRAALEKEAQHQRAMRAIESSARSRTNARLAKARGGRFGGSSGSGPARARAHEAQSESDDEVRQNIDPSLIPLFERVKRGIRATPRMSRTEAFMQYVEEHPREVNDAVEDATDALIAQLERRQRTGSDLARAARDVARMASLVARDGGRRYVVYVAKVENTRNPTVYVGSTARGLRLRRRQHRRGLMARTHHVGRLIPVMRVATRAEAERGEGRVARALRTRGYTVHGDH